MHVSERASKHTRHKSKVAVQSKARNAQMHDYIESRSRGRWQWNESLLFWSLSFTVRHDTHSLCVRFSKYNHASKDSSQANYDDVSRYIVQYFTRLEISGIESQLNKVVKFLKRFVISTIWNSFVEIVIHLDSALLKSKSLLNCFTPRKIIDWLRVILRRQKRGGRKSDDTQKRGDGNVYKNVGTTKVK